MNIDALQISQKDLRGITLHDFHKKLLEIGPVNGSSLMLIETAERNTTLYAEGEPFCTYHIVRSNGFERQNQIESQWKELFYKHVVSLSYVRFKAP